MGARSYLLCATPRTGSTLLGSLLSSTGVAGRPESYFRREDRPVWARRAGVPEPMDTGSFADFLAGVRRLGTTPNGVFGCRVMWGSVEGLVHDLDPATSGSPDSDVLERALGPMTFVHLGRVDVVGQAVSWLRAEQTGYWQQGDRAHGAPEFDDEGISRFVDMIDAHDAGWREWFDAQALRPVEVTYEALVDRPVEVVDTILSSLDLAVPTGWRPSSVHRRQADAVNEDWMRRHRVSTARLGGE